MHLLLADAQLLFRQSLAQALADAGWAAITQVSTQAALEQALLETSMTLLIIDKQLPAMDITRYCQLLMQQHPQLRILILTGYEIEARELQYSSLLAGAAGCLSKEHPAAIYTTAIQMLSQGHIYYQYLTVQHALRAHTPVEDIPVVAAIPARVSSAVLAHLTPRELEILQLVAQGKGNPEIALTLNITDNTVMKHVSHVINKLGVRNRMEAGLVYLNTL